MATYQERVGTMIRKLREKAGVSGNALAKAAGISQPYLWQIENGEHDPPAGTLKKIADALGVSAKKLLP